jgi:hypothetical protein
MARVFDEPDAVLQKITRLAPFKAIGSIFGSEEVQTVPNWFFASLTETPILHDPNWTAAAQEAFGATIVRPIRCALNLNPPAPAGEPHLDMPSFRGFAAPDAPLWLLGAMSRSRLFLDWLVPLASGIAWFWRGEGGEFTYWLDGPESQPNAESSPLWNVGVMSDNEVMWHRVGAIGPAQRREEFAYGLPRAAELHRSPKGWIISHAGRTLANYLPDEVRISIVWKGYVFKDEAHLASFEDRDYDLSLDQVVQIFREDFASRGLPSHCPLEPLADLEWRALLEGTYVSPFSGSPTPQEQCVRL